MTNLQKFTVLVVSLSLAGLLACGARPSGQEPAAADSPAGGAALVAQDAAAGSTLNHGVEEFEVEGIRVILKPTPANAIVSVVLFIDGGVALADAERSGVERVAMILATEGGPATMSKLDYTTQLESMGSTIGGHFSYDFTLVSMSAIEQTFEQTWSLFAQAITAPAWREEDLRLARERILTSLRQELDDPDGAVSVLARRHSFEGHLYENRPQGELEVIEALGVSELQGAWEALLERDRMTLVVAGNIPRARIETLVAEALGGLPMGSRAGVTVEPLRFDAPRVHLEERAGLPTNYVLGYFGAPSRTDADYAALEVGLGILSDRLFEEVRTRRNLSYAVSAGLSDRRAATGFMYVTAVDVETTLGVMFDTLQDMIDHPVPESDLHDQLALTLTNTYRTLQTNRALAALLGDWAVVGGGREQADLHLARLASVTPEQVSQALDTWVRNIQFVVLGGSPDFDPEVLLQR